jgi:hypothetical protein
LFFSLFSFPSQIFPIGRTMLHFCAVKQHDWSIALSRSVLAGCKRTKQRSIDLVCH